MTVNGILASSKIPITDFHPSKPGLAVTTSPVSIATSGFSAFYTYSDDGSKLFIDGKAIVDNDGSHNARIAKGKVALDAGFHELRVLYFEDYMGEALEVGVSSRKIKEAVLPEDWYYLPE